MTERDDWLQWRRQGLGASDIGALLGLSSYSSPWSLWAEKVGLRPARETTERQQMGHDFEPVIAQLFTRRTGLYVAGEQTWCQNPAEPWMRCTADGFVFDGQPDEGEAHIKLSLGGFEAKTDGRFGWPDGVPPAYQAQCQWSMAVTGLDRWFVAVLFSGWRFDVFEVKRDDEDIAFMRRRARDFWFDHVVAGNPPPTDGSQATLDALAEVYPEHTPSTSVELDDEARGALASYEEAAREIKQWTMRKDRARAHLEAALGDAEEGCVDGVRVCSWRSQHRDAYTVAESNFRVFRTHTSKKENAT